MHHRPEGAALVGALPLAIQHVCRGACTEMPQLIQAQALVQCAPPVTIIQEDGRGLDAQMRSSA